MAFAARYWSWHKIVHYKLDYTVAVNIVIMCVYHLIVIYLNDSLKLQLVWWTSVASLMNKCSKSSVTLECCVIDMTGNLSKKNLITRSFKANEVYANCHHLVTAWNHLHGNGFATDTATFGHCLTRKRYVMLIIRCVDLQTMNACASCAKHKWPATNGIWLSGVRMRNQFSLKLTLSRSSGICVAHKHHLLFETH